MSANAEALLLTAQNMHGMTGQGLDSLLRDELVQLAALLGACTDTVLTELATRQEFMPGQP